MKITVNQLRRIIKEEVQKTLNENVEDVDVLKALEALKAALKVAVLAIVDPIYGGEDYDVQGIVNTVFRDLTLRELSSMSADDIAEKVHEFIRNEQRRY